MTSHISKPTTAPIVRAATTTSFQAQELSGPTNTELRTLDSRGTGLPAQTPTPPVTELNAPEPKRYPAIRRFLGDGLFAYITYSIAFILLFNSGTNSMQIGRFLLLCINSNKNTTSSSTEQDNDNQDLMRFIGVFVLSIICLLQYFSPGFGRRMNKTLAVIKLAFMVALFIVGIAATGRKTNIILLF